MLKLIELKFETLNFECTNFKRIVVPFKHYKPEWFDMINQINQNEKKVIIYSTFKLNLYLMAYLSVDNWVFDAIDKYLISSIEN